MAGGYRCFNPSVFALLLMPPGTLSNRQIHEDLGFRCLPTTSEPCCELRLKVSWCGEPPSTATRQILTLTECCPRRLKRKPSAAGASRPVETIAHDSHVDQTNRVRRWSAERLSVTLTEVFCDFPQLLGNARVHDAKSGHGPHSPPTGPAASPKRLKKVANLQFVTEPVWAQNPESHPTKVYPSHN